jgi:hypothetical protein
MVVGMHVVSSPPNHWLGIVATLDKNCSVYFSMVERFDTGDDKALVLFAQAVEYYAQKNEGVLPKHVIVYSSEASADPLRRACAALDAHLTFVILEETSEVIFARSEASLQKPKIGTLVRSDARSAVPTFTLACDDRQPARRPYSFAALELSIGFDVLVEITHKLCFMYWPHTGGVAAPAPFLYAQDVAACGPILGDEKPSSQIQGSMWFL